MVIFTGRRIMERIPIGIKDFESMIEGGYPKNRTMLVIGATGSGKTILGLHFINQGCMDGKKCMIIATEEIPEDILAQSRSLGMHLDRYQEKGDLTIERVYEERAGNVKNVLGLGIEKIDDLESNILGLIDRIPEGTEIVLIDNVGVLTLNMSVNEFRSQFDLLIYGLNKRKITSMVIIDISANERTGDTAAYSVSGVIRMSIKENPFTGARERLLDIMKIRNTKIPLEPIRFDITSSGIVFLKK